jgi:hypothetical protein
MGSRYQHLANNDSALLFDWQGHEQDSFMDDPNLGVNGDVTDPYTSLFLRDVSNGTGITTDSSIAGYADCLGKVSPKVVGYYMGRYEATLSFPRRILTFGTFPKVRQIDHVSPGTRMQSTRQHFRYVFICVRDVASPDRECLACHICLCFLNGNWNSVFDRRSDYAGKGHRCPEGHIARFESLYRW